MQFCASSRGISINDKEKIVNFIQFKALKIGDVVQGSGTDYTKPHTVVAIGENWVAVNSCIRIDYADEDKWSFKARHLSDVDIGGFIINETTLENRVVTQNGLGGVMANSTFMLTPNYIDGWKLIS